MKIKLYRLRILAGQCEVISSQRTLGFVTEMKIGKLGKLAIEAINYHAETGLNPILEEKQKLVEEIIKNNADVPQEGLNDIILADAKFKEIYAKEVAFWNSETEEFVFDPVMITLKEDYTFKDQTKEATHFGITISIDPYVSLQNLIDEGFVKVNE